MAERKLEVPRVRVDIIGTGHFLGEKIVDNEELFQMMLTAGYKDKRSDRAGPLSPELMGSLTGIRERPFAEPAGYDATGRLAVEAARMALGDDIDPKSIDFVYLGTSTGDRVAPATVHRIQRELGLINASPRDINVACNSFTDAYVQACGVLKLRIGANRALVIGGDALNRVLNLSDRNSAPLFSAAAGAVVLDYNRKSDSGPLQVYWKSKPDTDEDGLLTCAHGTGEKIKIKGLELAGDILGLLKPLVKQAKKDFERRGVTKFILLPHQASGRVIDKIGKLTGIPEEDVIRFVDIIGNSSAGTVPTAWSMAEQAGMIAQGDNMCVAGVGVGAAATVVRMRR